MECPFCGLDGLTTEEERLEHVLEEHSTRLAMAAATLSCMRRLGVGFESVGGLRPYREWVEQRKAQRRA